MILALPISSWLIALFTGAGFANGSDAGTWAALADGFSRFAHAAAPVAVTALWQGAVVAAGLALCLRFAPRVAAAHRFAAWAAGLLVLVALPFAPALARLMATGADSNIGTASLGSPASQSWLGHAGLAHPWLQLSDGWCMAIAALWLVVALLRAADLVNHSFRLRRLWKNATPIEARLFAEERDEKVILPARETAGAKAQPWEVSTCGPTEVVPLLQNGRETSFFGHQTSYSATWPALRAVFPLGEALRATLALEGSDGQVKFELCTTRELDRPSVIGFFAPRILIPEWLLERLTQQELEQVVLHEAEHLRRRDDWTNLLQKLCLVVFPLNPALMFVERRLCREREMACDEGVVRRTQAPRAYAACLAALAERHMERRAESLSLGARAKALTLSAYERRPELARRVHSLLVRRSAIDPVASRALVGAVGCALVVGTVALARCPQLVAYVPAQPRVTVETAGMVPASLQPGEPDAMAASHFRAINAMAIMPQTTERSAKHCRASLGKAEPHALGPKPGPAAMSSLKAMATQSDPITDIANNETAVPQELIVLTAYEQVQTGGEVQGDRVISDYGPDTGARPADGSAGRITITRLIFRVYPAGPKQATAILTMATKPGESKPTGAQPAAQTSTQSGNQETGKPNGQAMPRVTNSLTGLPHAVALGNGWFVIQL